jgi:hypothetical protein
LKDGTLQIGDGLLSPIPLQSGTSFSLDLASQPLSAPIGLTVLSAPVNQSGTGYSFTGTVDVIVAGAGATIDPATGEATVDASFYGTLSGSGNVTVANVSLPVSGSCSLGSSQQPVNLHFTTAQGSAWDPATGSMSLADRAFALAYSCDPALFQTLIGLIAGATDAGHNVATIVGTAIRRPDVVTAPTTTTSQPGTGGGATTPTVGNPGEVTPVTTPTAKACVVPKLVGRTLKQAKRALKKAGCNAGKSKKANSKKHKKGRIVKQRYKAGTKLPAGAKVPITISKGPKKARRHRSR